MQIMKSWTCNSQGKGLGLPEGIIPCTDGLTRIKDTPTKWELEYPCNNDNTVLISGQDATENLRYVESLAGDTQKIFSESIGELFNRSIVQGQVTTSASHSFSQKAASGEEETGSKNSSSVIDSDTRESSIIDLKLGRFSDCRSSNKCKPIRDAETFTSLASPIPAKRIRPTSLNGQTSFCQVLDCNVDLSDSKDYYKRHKVCEIHSKTAEVIVNGIQQRFCQQCSRFHLLDAFDDGKRSCRKRLAGHNERRRKPQIDIQSSRTGRVIQPYHGLAFLGTTSSGSTSFVSPDMFPCGILQEVNYENTNWQRRAQSREGTLSSGAPPPTTVNGQLFPRSLNTSCGTQKHFSSNVGNVISESIHYDYGNRYEPGFGASNLVFDNELHNKGFPGVSVSTCAHSLLSYQAQRSYLYPREVPVSAQPLLFQDGNVQYSKEPFFDKALAVGLQASTSVASSSCYSPRMNSVQDHQMSLLASYSFTAEDFDIQRCGNFQGSHLINAKDQLSHEGGHTINLLQLSSLLQNAEERGKSVQVKQESDSFKSLPNL